MGLRRQLFFVSLLTLLLPWAGCQYLREMESVVRQGHAQSLIATAQAVSARIAADEQLAGHLNQSMPGLARRPVIYAHPLATAPIIDGYRDEWTDMEVASEVLGGIGRSAWRADLLAGSHADFIYLWVEVNDANRQFYTPGSDLRQVDHLRIVFAEPDGTSRRYGLFTAAPGEAQVFRYHEDFLMYREHRFKAFWQERGDAYLVELRFPREWAEGGMALDIYDGGRQSVVLSTGAAPRPVVAPSDIMQDTLAVYAEQGRQLTLLSHAGYWLASAGSLARSGDSPGTNDTAFRYLVRDLFNPAGYPPRPRVAATGQMLDEVSMAAISGNIQYDWYQYMQTVVTRVAVPVVLPNLAGSTPVAIIVAEQTTEAAGLRVDAAGMRLLIYSGAVVALVSLLMLAHATWLSVRIRRLKRAVESAVSADGRITGLFPASSSHDEIGDLSRSYSTLLERLREYNTYLETLASKLSHELRTPVAVVRTSLDNLAEMALNDESVQYVVRARDGVERLSAILHAMSAAARVEQSLQGAEMELVDVGEMLRQVVNAYRDIYPDHRLVWQCDVESPQMAWLSPDLVVQMLDKLVENAADFAGPGGLIEFTVRTDGETLLLQVANSGSELPEAMSRRIFDSLVSVRKPGSPKEHLGLGLYIVRLIAQFHGGQVRAFTDQARGLVVFEIRMPLHGGRPVGSGISHH